MNFDLTDDQEMMRDMFVMTGGLKDVQLMLAAAGQVGYPPRRSPNRAAEGSAVPRPVASV